MHSSSVSHVTCHIFCYAQYILLCDTYNREITLIPAILFIILYVKPKVMIHKDFTGFFYGLLKYIQCCAQLNLKVINLV